MLRCKNSSVEETLLLLFCASFILCGLLFGVAVAQVEGDGAQGEQVENEQEEGEDLDEVGGWKYGSLMYDEKAVGWVKQAIKSYEKNIPIEILLPNIFVSEDAEQSLADQLEQERREAEAQDAAQAAKDSKVEKKFIPVEAPVFYLKSIMYFAEDNWTVWVNDKKLQRGDVIDGLRIVSVMVDKAVFVWNGDNLDVIYPNWKKEMIRVGGGKYVNSTGNIMIDSVSGKISFSLSANQSLVSRNMSIVEGVVQPTMITENNVIGDLIYGEEVDGVDDFEENSLQEEGQDSIIMDDVLGGENMENYMEQLNMLKMMLGSGEDGE